MNEWQPIETAPKDGSAVMLIDERCEYLPDRWAIAYWRPDSWANDWRVCGADGRDYQTDIEPTHWQPLPEPPK